VESPTPVPLPSGEAIIDCDVHPPMTGSLENLLPYMPRAWSHRLDYLANLPFDMLRASPRRTTRFTPRDSAIAALAPADGPAFLRSDYLDVGGASLLQLILSEVAAAALHPPDPAVSATLVAALNDYVLDHWLDDSRVRYCVMVSTGDIDRAVEELNRLAPDPRICSFWFPIEGIRLGDSRLYPLYEAALDHDLPLVSHAGSGIHAAGDPQLAVEERVDLALIAAAQLNSLVMNGVFERYPRLRVMFVEYGFTWLVPHMWRMDAGWLRNRNGVPWVRKPPSEYVREHVALSLQPVDDSPAEPELCRMIEDESGTLATTLVYSTDYPFCDSVTSAPRFVARLALETRRAIFSGNAERLLRLGS
jgi:predicted TIM-barrel fold metal-dependent hydrolase